MELGDAASFVPPNTEPSQADPQRGPASENCGVLIGLVIHIDFYGNNLVQAGSLTIPCFSIFLFKAV